MSNHRFPVKAYEAAHAAICEQNLDDCLDPDWRGKCVKAVDAAAPHLLSELCNLVEQMEAQPWTEAGTVRGMAALIRSSTRGLL